MSKVAFVKTEDRANGVKSSITTLGLNPVKNKDVHVIDFDDLDQKDWVEFKPKDSHWKNGFRKGFRPWHRCLICF